MLKRILISTTAILAFGCQSKDESNSNLRDAGPTPQQQPPAAAQATDTDGKPSAADKHVYAFLYAQQSLQSSDDYLLPSEFDAVAYVKALLEVKTGISTIPGNDSIADILKLAVSEEILRAVSGLVMEGADTDADNKIAYDEFMNYRIGKWEPTPELDDNINAWRQAAFPIVAGFDGEIDRDELLALLVMQRPHVQNLRNDPELFRKLVRVTRDQFVLNFDENGDGTLNGDELKDVRDAIIAERDRYLEKVDEMCSDENNSEEPVCRIDAAFHEACEKAEEGSMMAGLCKILHGN